MKRRSFLRMTASAGLVTLIIPTGIRCSLQHDSQSSLDQSFVGPPDSARPYTWWHWVNGNVSKEGITLDLEAMKRVGLGGFQQFEVGRFAPLGRAPYGSSRYWESKKHAIKEADRLGLNFEMHNCPGWSSSGGPWITPELSMQMLTWSESQIEGGGLVNIKLPHPPAPNGYYRDFCVLAFPSSDAVPISDWADKANFPRGEENRLSLTGEDAQSQPRLTTSPINPSAVRDINQYMDRDGRLTWQAPVGSWTILRLGATTTAATNVVGPDRGVGLECDKFSKTAIEFHFNKILENLLPTLSSLAKKGRVGLLIDSYEVGLQNWTLAFPEEFKKRRGYDLRSYLPAMTGRVVESLDTSERFLWDVRRTQADLMADNYYGYFTELCHRHGIVSYVEPYGGGNFEELQAGSRADRVMGEFWLAADNNRSVKLAASVGHVFGKKVIGAESFTGFPPYSKWQEYPFMMKPMGDWTFTQGINRFMFHRFAHQPHPTAQPGMTMGPWGFHFDRTNTWFEKSKPWLEYLARCQSLLQQGLFVADLLYFGGEDAPRETPILSTDLNPPPAEGYQWDVANAEAILNRLSITNGRIILPDGMSYRLLIVPARTTMTLEVLKRLRDLVNQGMVLVGEKPASSPSLADQKREAEFTRIANEIWGDLREGLVAEHRLGLGGVFWSQPLESLLEKLTVKPDFTFTSESGDAPINFIHRTIDGAEVYFLANRRRRNEEIVATFRVQNRRPELLEPDSGSITALDVYELVDGGVRLPLRFDSAGSMFVVFRSKAAPRRLHRVERNGEALISTKPFALARSDVYRDVMNNFSISVWVKPEVELRFPTAEQPTREHFNFIIYPPPGEKLYGAGHAACGLTAGRNGVILFERSSGKPKVVLNAETPLAGWTHLAVTYEGGLPSLYVNGKLAQQRKSSGMTVHPGLGEAHQSNGAYYYVGHMSEPELFREILNADGIHRMVVKGPPKPAGPPALEAAGNGQPGFLIWQNGNYTFRDNNGKSSSTEVTGIGKPRVLTGAWKVSFPPNLGAPTEINLPELISLHRHSEDGVKYFSGTATYQKQFSAPASALENGKRLFLDLGGVEVIAEVRVNGKGLGILWKPPYRVEITEAVRTGENDLEIEVTNLWPNRLIGDEQLPAENEFYSGLGYGGSFPAGLTKLPDWYLEGRPKPPGGRITFSTWKHYEKASPLLESGLIGPVTVRTAMPRTI